MEVGEEVADLRYLMGVEAVEANQIFLLVEEEGVVNRIYLMVVVGEAAGQKYLMKGVEVKTNLAIHLRTASLTLAQVAS